VNSVVDSDAQDAEHLRLLRIFHWVVAGLTALFSLFPIIHLVIGIAMVSGGFHGERNPPPAAIGWIFIVFAAGFILTGLTFSACLAYAGECLKQRQRYTFCLVMAALACMLMPFGTVLGVFTLITLMKPSVKALFTAPSPGA